MTWNTDTLRAALRHKFPAKEYAVLEEVRNSTGFTRRERYADALVMGLWPSRGLTLLGIEIKQSRPDWMAELKQPEKADAIARYCDQWALLVSDPKIVQPGELPPNWGLLAPNKAEWSEGGKLKWLKEPTALSPVPIDRTFLAALCRAVARDESAELDRRLGSRLETARKEAQQALQAGHRQEVDRLEKRLNVLTTNVRTFEEATGLRVGEGWHNRNLGDQLRQLNRLSAIHGFQEQLLRLAQQAQAVARAARENQWELNEEPGDWSI